MLELSRKTNLLEQATYKYSLQDIEDPNLYRDLYPYDSVPKISFNHRKVPMGMPEEIWITDTSLRDGQQSVEPYTVKQIVDLYKLMSKLGGPFGIIRQTEFFVYSQKDRKALEECQALGLKFPEITTWIRANKEYFKLVKESRVPAESLGFPEFDLFLDDIVARRIGATMITFYKRRKIRKTKAVGLHNVDFIIKP